MKKRNKAFIAVSIAIALVDVMFVAVNAYFSRHALILSLEQEGESLRHSFDMLLDRTYSNMLAMATFIANDPEVQSLFLAGKKAVLAEGGGAGGPESARIRQKLLEKVGPNWKKVQDDFNVRQLHFHLGPGSTSFLRVHRPDRFGDDMDDVRFTVVDTNAEQTARAGFETGRVYAGLRGIVPVPAFDPDLGRRVHVGALEVGTSFTTTLAVLDQRLGHGVGVLLDMDHVRATMWPDFIKDRFGDGTQECGCAIEAASRDGLDPILSFGFQDGIDFRADQTDVFEINQTPLIVTHFPLRDYLGSRDPDRENVGAVIFWRDGSDQIAAYRNGILFNILYGIVGYIIVEILLLFGFRFAVGHLQRQVKAKTEELEVKADEMRRLSITDRLTGLFNRLKLDEAFFGEIERCRRYKPALSIVIFDIDHFKSVNDIHGHQKGDEVLVTVAKILQENVRAVDIPGRWGGEEFLVICPETDVLGARALAEKVRTALETHVFPDVGCKTASFGVAEFAPGDTIETLTGRADQALYRAKTGGRNRVESG